MNEEDVSETTLVTELKALKWAVVLAGAIVGFSLCIVTAGPRGQIAGGVVAFIAGVGALVGMLRNRSVRDKKWPNKAPEPTPTSVTPPADEGRTE